MNECACGRNTDDTVAFSMRCKTHRLDACIRFATSCAIVWGHVNNAVGALDGPDALSRFARELVLGACFLIFYVRFFWLR